MTAAPLRVGLNLLHLVEGAGGAGRYARELIPALLDVEPDIRIVAFTTDRVSEDVAAAPWAEGVEWVRYSVEPAARRALVTQHIEIPLAARRRKVDVLHSPANIGVITAAGAANVVSALDLIWLHESTSPLGRRERLRARILFTLCARAADRVITISEATKRDLVDTIGLAPDRIDVTPLGVARDLTEPTPEAELRRRFGLDGRPLILTVAQKQPHKNLEAVIRAVADVGDAQLVLAGAPAPHERELRRLAEEVGAGDRVRFLDWLADGDLQGLYRAATCFVLPSFIEGFGLPVLESMQHGTPVACSDRSALAEVADGAALLFDPHDQATVTSAVRRLIKDTSLRVELAERGRQRAAEFTWRRTAQDTLRSYRLAVEARER